MISVGGLIMENEPNSTEEIITDLLGMIKGIQNPIRGLFTRYFLLKRIKDKLPDKGNKYLEEGGKFEDTLKFIIQNMEEMNYLWIRISAEATVGPEKILRDRERVELKILVGESINRLSSLDGLTIEIYEQQVLPKLLKIILQSNDIMSQQYLMECIIHAFSDNYNIKCIELLLTTVSKLLPGVDTQSLYINIMEKLANFITTNSGENVSEEDKQLVAVATGVYPTLIEYFNRLQKEIFMLGADMDILKLLDLNAAFLKYSIQCKENDVLESINHVLSCTLQCFRVYNRILSNDGLKKLNRLLEVPLTSDYSIFDMADFDGLIEFLNNVYKKNLSLNIIQSICNPDSKEVVDSVEKVQKLFKLIRPLMEDMEEIFQEDLEILESEQSELCKLLYVIKTDEPEIHLQILEQFKIAFLKGGEKRKKITLPTLANNVILFCHKLTSGYDNKNGLISEEQKKNTYVVKSIETFDVNKIEDNETFNKLMLSIYKLLNEIITIIEETNPELAFKLYLLSASQVNTIQSDRNNFEESCDFFMNAAMKIYQEGKYNQNVKYQLLSNICAYLLNFTILSKEKVENILKILIETGSKIPKRGDQVNSMLDIGQVYYFVFKDGKKVTECINKARRFADFALTNPQNLSLYIEMLNKYLYYADLGDESVTVTADQIEDIIELTKNHIETIKTEMALDANFVTSVETYFNKTIEYILKMKKTENHKPIYDSLQNN
jgi:vacuolar protein sorting-associated protein 35